MIISLQSQLKIWAYARRNTVHFLEQLSEADLHKKLPRKTFTTIFEQMAEMVWVQKCFMDGIKSGKMDNTDWSVPAFETKTKLLDFIKATDEKMAELLEKCNGAEEVVWNNNSRNVNEVLSLMLMHETMHLGQVIAFCHSLAVDIPKGVANDLYLTG